MDSKRALRQLNEFSKRGSNMRLAAEDWKNDFEILISTIMSARTRDEVTIPTAQRLFKKYPNPSKLSKAHLSDIQSIIRPVNFYKNKSKNILACSKKLFESFNCKIPKNFDELLTLPGVGRKTANVFLSEVGKDAIGVDTHVAYISNKIGWTKSIKPEKIEEDLKKLFPQKYWSRVNSTLVRFGKTHLSRKKKDKLIKEIQKIK